MKTTLFALAIVAAAVSSTSAFAGAEDLAKAKNCLACHSLDKKIVGPAYKDVAAKYKGQAGAEAKLAAKILAGGAGVWGPVPMPANTQVSPAEANELAKWVLTIK